MNEEQMNSIISLLAYLPPPPSPSLTLLTHQRNQILQIALRYGAYNVRIFGYVARREADSMSDIDLLVDLEPGRSLLDLGGLLMDLQTLLGYRVDVATSKGLKPFYKTYSFMTPGHK